MSKGFDHRSSENSLSAAMSEAIRSKIVEVHTALPGEIIAFDADQQTAQVRLCVQREVLGETKPIADLMGVPVVIQGGGGLSLTFPIQAGDPCLIIFCERGIDNWYMDDGCQPPASRRLHHLSDAVCIPGLRAAPRALPSYDTSRVMLRSDDGIASISMTEDGKFAMTNGVEELLSILSEVIGELQGLQTIVTGGSSAGTYGHDRQNQLQALRDRLDTLMQ